MADDEQQQSSLGRSLSARLRRKEQVARGEAVPEMPDEEPPAVGQTESDEDAALTDDELLAKYELEDPETIEDEARLDAFLEGKFPDRIRQMALRRMWRLNPMFRFADEMVEYGENYTDAATVIDGMTTAYQVGKGYLQKAFDAVDEAPEDALSKAPAAASEEAPKAIDEAESTEGSTSASAPDIEEPETVETADQPAGHQPEQEAESPQFDDAPVGESERPSRAKRMVFTKTGAS